MTRAVYTLVFKTNLSRPSFYEAELLCGPDVISGQITPLLCRLKLKSYWKDKDQLCLTAYVLSYYFYMDYSSK